MKFLQNVPRWAWALLTILTALALYSWYLNQFGFGPWEIVSLFVAFYVAYAFGHLDASQDDDRINWLRIGAFFAGYLVLMIVFSVLTLWTIQEVYNAALNEGRMPPDIETPRFIIFLIFFIILPLSHNTARVFPFLKSSGVAFQKKGFVLTLLFFLGLFLAPVVIGVLWGYAYGYKRILRPKGEIPRFHDLPALMKVYMFLGPFLLVIIIGLVIYIAIPLSNFILGALLQGSMARALGSTAAFTIIVTNFFITIISLGVFNNFWNREINTIYEGNRYGSARFAKNTDLIDMHRNPPKDFFTINLGVSEWWDRMRLALFDKYHDSLKRIMPKTRLSFLDFKMDILRQEFEDIDKKNRAKLGKRKGIYIGGGDYVFDKSGHLLTVAGTRSGKGTNLIIPNLLGKGHYDGSWIVIDPKGQNAFLSHTYQRERCERVIVLNPWHLYEDLLTAKNPLPQSDTYNPLDLISDPDSPYLWDDCLLIAETIIPVSHDKNSHWDDRARTLLALTLAQLATSKSKDRPLTLETAWRALSPEDGSMRELFQGMATNVNPINGEVIRRQAGQMLSLMGSQGDGQNKEFASILSTTQRHMDIIASLQVRESTTQSTFTIKNLIENKFALYIVIPPTKLLTHGKWLRLVITTLMRGIVKKRGSQHRITFLLDEFYSLGYLREIEVGLAQYSGYNISLWPILQSVNQLKQIYPRSWESFIDNSAIQHYFGINGEATMTYVSKMSGTTSYPTFNQLGQVSGATARPLLTTDEVRLGSKTRIFTFAADKPLASFFKLPYHKDPEFTPGKHYPADIPKELK